MTDAMTEQIPVVAAWGTGQRGQVMTLPAEQVPRMRGYELGGRAFLVFDRMGTVATVPDMVDQLDAHAKGMGYAGAIVFAAECEVDMGRGEALHPVVAGPAYVLTSEQAQSLGLAALVLCDLAEGDGAQLTTSNAGLVLGDSRRVPLETVRSAVRSLRGLQLDLDF